MSGKKLFASKHHIFAAIGAVTLALIIFYQIQTQEVVANYNVLSNKVSSNASSIASSNASIINSFHDLPLDLQNRIEADIANYANMNQNRRISLEDLQACTGGNLLLMYIINGRLYYEKTQYEKFAPKWTDKKTNKINKVLKSIVQMYDIPNTVFLFNKKSTGRGCHLYEKNISVPTFCIARTDADEDAMSYIEVGESLSKHCILFPNPYFESLYDWKKLSKKILSGSKSIQPKIKKLFWLGSIQGAYGFTRGKFLWQAHKSDLIDAHSLKRQNLSWDILKGPESWKHYTNISDREVRNILSLPRKPSARGDEFWSQFGKYEANLALPGQSLGSYSRHLQFVLALDTVPFLWDSVWYEWYYHALRHNYNIIKVNADNVLDETKRVLNMNQSQISFIKRKKEKLFDRYLSAKAVGSYIYNLLVYYQYNIGPKIKDWNEIKQNLVRL